MLVTDLTNYCVPLIRYALGDLATATDRAVRLRARPAADRRRSRAATQAIIIGTNGCFLPGTFFAHLLKDYGHILKQFQVVQEGLGAIEFKVVRGPRFSDASLEKILAIFRRHLGEDMQIDVDFVDHIALVRTGKHRHSVSKLKITPGDLRPVPHGRSRAAPRIRAGGERVAAEREYRDCRDCTTSLSLLTLQSLWSSRRSSPTHGSPAHRWLEFGHVADTRSLFCSGVGSDRLHRRRGRAPRAAPERANAQQPQPERPRLIAHRSDRMRSDAWAGGSRSRGTARWRGRSSRRAVDRRCPARVVRVGDDHSPGCRAAPRGRARPDRARP